MYCIIFVHIVNPIVQPRQIANLSIPGLLTNLQNEWDELVLELFNTKQSLDVTRRELTQALYQHDAACRVIARLMRERDEARYQLQQYVQNHQQMHEDSTISMNIDDNNQNNHINTDYSEISKTLSNEHLNIIIETNKELSTKRKNRKVSITLVKKESLQSFNTKQSIHPFEEIKTKGRGSKAKQVAMVSDKADNTITLFDMNITSNQIIVSNGKSIVSYSIDDEIKGNLNKDFNVESQGNIVSINSLKTQVNSKHYLVAYHNFIHLYDKNEIMNSFTFESNNSNITNLDIQPSNQYFVTSTSNGFWDLWNLHGTSSNSLLRHINTKTNKSIDSLQFHPDGFILGLGSENSIQLWDVREQVIASKLIDSNVSISSISCLSFSENGYLLASASPIEHLIHIWDLRKLAIVKSFQTTSGASKVNFDLSGQYFAFNQGNSLQGAVVKEYKDDLFPVSYLVVICLQYD